MTNKKNRSYRRRRWNLLSREREAHRIARIGRIYDPERGYRARVQFRTNPRFRVRKPSKGTARIELPQHLRFDSEEDMETVFLLAQRFRDAALNDGYRRVVLAQENVLEIAPEAAIVLLAELQRCWAYCFGRTTISGTYPREHSVAELLTNLGFYEALQVVPPQLPGNYDRRTFIKVVSGHETNSETIDTLLSEFDAALRFSAKDRKNLHVAILECMDNVREHAYSRDSNDPHLFREWWLVGTADKVTKTASFIFYDQGFGIVQTIRTFERKRLRGKFPAWTDSGWIEKAMNEQFSRHISKRRGHGLPKLQQFIVDAELTGSMRVIANRGEYTQISHQPSTAKNLGTPAPGTMISWSLSMPPDVQLRLDL